MRILIWNVGIFSWYKYAYFFNLKIKGEKIKHEYFQKAYLEEISTKILEINPDICILQEFHENLDRQLMIGKLQKKYPYNISLSSWYHDHTIMVFSVEKIELEELAKSGFFVVKIKNLFFTPIHLHSFLSFKRLKQVKKLTSEINDRKIDFIAGDTNLWNFGKKPFFFFRSDKKAYQLLIKKFTDSTKNIGHTTKAFTNFDKIFLAKDIEYKKPICLKENEKCMDHYPVFVDLLLPEQK